ncbi:MAG: ATP-binding cassette domain-containing protein [Chloroflexota bacterium]|nr:ATP-binding cassette domain-containing protein [Chloroflexota bacterium]
MHEAVALQGLDLSVGPGEVVAVVGRSGSGKTTLLDILAGDLRPSAGAVRVAGHDLARLPDGAVEEFQLGIGHVRQRPMDNLDADLSAAENVELPLVARGVSASSRRQIVRDMLETFEISSLANTRPARLSGGEQQRAALAAALAPRPVLLLADEPTAEMDSATADQALGAMRRTAGELGTTVVLVTHDVQSQRHVDRVVNIRDGRTSTEKLAARDELVVLDRVGRMQLPEHLVKELGLRGRVRVRRAGGHIVIEPADDSPRD